MTNNQNWALAHRPLGTQGIAKAYINKNLINLLIDKRKEMRITANYRVCERQRQRQSDKEVERHTDT